MAIVNRRNAVLGWAVWRVATSMAKAKAKHAVPRTDNPKSRWVKRAAAVAAGFAAASGAVFYWRKATADDESPPVV